MANPRRIVVWKFCEGHFFADFFGRRAFIHRTSHKNPATRNQKVHRHLSAYPAPAAPKMALAEVAKSEARKLWPFLVGFGTTYALVFTNALGFKREERGGGGREPWARGEGDMWGGKHLVPIGSGTNGGWGRGGAFTVPPPPHLSWVEPRVFVGREHNGA